MKEVCGNKLCKGLEGKSVLADLGSYITSSITEIRSYYLIIIFMVIIAITLGCAVKEIPVTRDNRLVEMPHYSVELPLNSGWTITELNKNRESVIISKRDDKAYYLVKFCTNKAVGEHMKSWTAKQLADDYRNGEKLNMIMQGVVTGEYQLKDVFMGEEMISDRNFYYMDYVTVRGNIMQKASLYLYIPNEEYIGYFVVSVYSENYSQMSSTQASPVKREYIEMLKTIQMRE